MEIKVYTINVDVPQRLKKLFVRFGIPTLLFFGMLGSIQADTVTELNAFSNGDVLSAADLNENFTKLKDAINGNAAAIDVNAQALTPPGTIVAFGGSEAPDGWLVCDGAEVSRTSYANLFSAISINFGSGDGVNTFNLPDLRGVFLRGKSISPNADQGLRTDGSANPDIVDEADTDGNDNIGRLQVDSFAEHSHKFNVYGFDHLDALCRRTANTGAENSFGFTSGGECVGTTFLDPEGNNETRPKNVTVLYIIKY